MMRRGYTACLLLTLFCLGGGCIVSSLHPFYLEEDRAPLPQLVGTWVHGDGGEIWTFAEEAALEYRLRLIDEEGLTALFVVRPFRLKEHLFLGVYPDGNQETAASPYWHAHIVPVHGVLRVLDKGPSLKLAPLDFAWVDKQLRKQPDRLAHERVQQERFILTDKTQALQDFLLEHIASDGAYGKTITLVPVVRPED